MPIVHIVESHFGGIYLSENAPDIIAEPCSSCGDSDSIIASYDTEDSIESIGKKILDGFAYDSQSVLSSCKLHTLSYLADDILYALDGYIDYKFLKETSSHSDIIYDSETCFGFEYESCDSDYTDDIYYGKDCPDDTSIFPYVIAHEVEICANDYKHACKDDPLYSPAAYDWMLEHGAEHYVNLAKQSGLLCDGSESDLKCLADTLVASEESIFRDECRYNYVLRKHLPESISEDDESGVISELYHVEHIAFNVMGYIMSEGCCKWLEDSSMCKYLYNRELEARDKVMTEFLQAHGLMKYHDVLEPDYLKKN